MKQFLEIVSQQIENFWWTENNSLSKMECRMGTESSDHITFKVTNDGTLAIIESTVFDGTDYRTMSPKHYSLATEEGQLIKKIITTSRSFLANDAELTNSYHELVANSEGIIRAFYNK